MLTICRVYLLFLQLERNLLQLVDSLVQDSDSDLWRSGRFLLNTGRQLASQKDGALMSTGFPMPPLFGVFGVYISIVLALPFLSDDIPCGQKPEMATIFF